MLTAIIVAAGSSRRMGFDKLFARLGQRTVIAHTIAAFEATTPVSEIVVVGRADRLDELRDVVRGEKFAKVRAIAAGGAERQGSVRIGLEAIADSARFIAIHDAARPLIRPEQIEQIYELARLHGAAASAAPVTDTLKRGDEKLFVAGGVDRARLFGMQTPQIFAREIIARAYREVFAQGLSVTDEVSAVELLGAQVRLWPNEDFNFKITFPGDLPVAEFLLCQGRQKVGEP